MFLSISGSNDFLQFVVLQFLFTQTTLWLSFNAPLVRGEGGGERARFPGALTTPEKEGNVNEISQKECLRLVEAGWLVGKRKPLINCIVWLGFYLGLLLAKQRSVPLDASGLSTELCPVGNLHLFSYFALYSTSLEQPIVPAPFRSSCLWWDSLSVLHV